MLAAALAFCRWHSPRRRAADPLPSWNDGAPKKAIVDFVEKVTKEGSPDFVPPAERIAMFDNDGTLWAEQPMYFQFLFALDRVKALAPQHPEWKDKEPFASLLKGDVKGALAGGEQALLRDRHGHARRHDHRGVRADRHGLDRHARSIPTTKRPYTEMVYQPMLELLAYLRANGFKTFIVSGGGIEFMRAVGGAGLRHPARAGHRQQRQDEVRAARRQAGAREAARGRLHRRQGRQAGRHPEASSAAGRSPRSATPTATCRCCSGPPPAPARASASTSTTPTPSASGPTTAQSHIGRLDKGLDEARRARLDRRRHEGRLEGDLSI